MFATLKLLLIVLPAFLVVDLVWLGVVMRSFYARELGDLARQVNGDFAPRWLPAIAVYLLIPIGLVVLLEPRITANSSVAGAFGWGALYGLIVYGVYDLTNLAILDEWTTRMTLADMAWGCTLCGASGVLLYLAKRWLGA